MIRSLESSVSALNAYSTQINASANNTANIKSEGFKRQEAVISENRISQPEAIVRTDNTQGPLVQTISSEGREKFSEMSNTDIAKETIQTITAQNAYNANLKTIETADKMAGTIIDIKG